MNENKTESQGNFFYTHRIAFLIVGYLITVLGFVFLFFPNTFAFDEEVEASTFSQTSSNTIAFTETVAKYCPSTTGECTKIVQPFIAGFTGVLNNVKLDLCRFNGTGSGTYNILIYNSANNLPNQLLASKTGYLISDLVANTSSGICTSWDTKIFDFTSEGIILSGGGQYYVVVQGVGAEQYTGKKAIQVSGSNYDYEGNPKWSNTAVTSFYPSDTSWNNYTVRFEITAVREITPNLPEYVTCLPHNYIPAFTGDEGDVSDIFNNLYQWVANTPVIGDALFVNCIILVDFLGNLEDVSLINDSITVNTYGGTTDIPLPYSDVYNQIQGWTSGISGFSAFKTLLNTILWTGILFAIFFSFLYKDWKKDDDKIEKELYHEETINKLDI